ncbi:MAG: Flagellar motor rotation protein MotB [Myxococcaceae bacterium]|nr:Flagellar motor rotation protein MotB [Myxococcaceae bacterium]
MFPSEREQDGALPVFAAFSDLMACVLGIFVLFFVWVVSFEVTMAGDLERERAERVEATDRLQAATHRLHALETSLAGPLSAGLITFVNGTIGIRGSVLFDLNSAELRGEGQALLRDMAQPLSTYLATREEALMISGFTDDLQIRGGPLRPYQDNWELSVQRAVTVVRALIEAGVPQDALFAAGFGQNHPVVPNDNDGNRAKNRRVEIAPVPRPRAVVLEAGPPPSAPAPQNDGAG